MGGAGVAACLGGHDSAYECHTCSDWGGCGGGCTLVALSCEGCGRTEYVKGPRAGEVITSP